MSDSVQFSQEAVYNAPGTSCSLALFKSREEDDGSAATMLARAAHLLSLVEQKDQDSDPLYRPANLQVMVAISATLLKKNLPAGDVVEFPEELPGSMGVMKRGRGQVDVLVQVAAQNEADRRYGLRLAVEVIERGYGLQTPDSPNVRHQEVHGARIFSGLEPFGYRDGGPNSTEGFPVALVEAVLELKAKEVKKPEWISELRKLKLLPDQELKNEARVVEILDRIKGLESRLPTSVRLEGSEASGAAKATNEILQLAAPQPVWLLYQRYQHDLDAFSSANAERNIGKKPFQTKDEAQPQPGSHLELVTKAAEAKILIRRGFAYRNDRGEEGLAFLAMAASPKLFIESLKRHLEQDRLLEMTRALDGGIYVVPPSSEWLTKSTGTPLTLAPGVPPIPAIAAQLQRPRASPIPGLIDYPVAAEMRDYVTLLRAGGCFLEPTMKLREDVEGLLRQLEDRCSHDGGANLRAIREKIRATSEAVYQQNGGYLVLGA